jgi:hypothetical protein
VFVVPTSVTDRLGAPTAGTGIDSRPTMRFNISRLPAKELRSLWRPWAAHINFESAIEKRLVHRSYMIFLCIPPLSLVNFSDAAKRNTTDAISSKS